MSLSRSPANAGLRTPTRGTRLREPLLLMRTIAHGAPIAGCRTAIPAPDLWIALGLHGIRRENKRARRGCLRGRALATADV